MKKLIINCGLVLLALSAMAATKLVTIDDTQVAPWDVERDYVLSDRIPIGTIVSYSSLTAPAGWFVCDGSAVSRASYSNLFYIISTNFGSGDGSTTFTLPDLRNRFALGVSGGLGVTGGVSSVTLTTNQMPAHAHAANYVSGTNVLTHSHNYDLNTYTPSAGELSGVRSTSSTMINSSGGGAAHTNMPPYQAVVFIIKHSDVIISSSQEVVRRDGTLPMTGQLETPNIKITSGATNGATFVCTNNNGQGTWSTVSSYRYWNATLTTRSNSTLVISGVGFRPSGATVHAICTAKPVSSFGFVDSYGNQSSLGVYDDGTGYSPNTGQNTYAGYLYGVGSKEWRVSWSSWDNDGATFTTAFSANMFTNNVMLTIYLTR